MEKVQLIVGLGNPGQEYEHTRHNAGALFVQELVKAYDGNLKPDAKFKGLRGTVNIDGRDLRILIPTTFMNLSGEAVQAISSFYRFSPESILVAHDELDLNPGTIRLKKGGGHGGHNGLKDIITKLGNNKNFNRLRVGIGHPGNPAEVSNFVLKKAPESEYELIRNSIDEAVRAMSDIANGEWDKAMKNLHTEA